MYTKDWRTFAFVEVRYRNGSIRYFASLEDALSYVGWRTIDGCIHGFLWSSVDHDDYMWMKGDAVEFRDELGLLIPLWRIREAAMHLGLHSKVYIPPWRIRYHFEFRNGPVPRSGRRRWSKCGGLRAIQTTQERRETDFLNNFDEESRECGYKPNTRRSKLPTTWDDYWVHPQKTWKKHRRNQWR